MVRIPPGTAFFRFAARVLLASATAGSIPTLAPTPTDAATPLRLVAEGYSVEHPADKHWSCESPGPAIRCQAKFGGLMSPPNLAWLSGDSVELEPREWRLSEDAVFDAWVADDFRWPEAEDVERGRRARVRLRSGRGFPHPSRLMDP